MKTGIFISLAFSFAMSLAACAPISAEKVAATARPAGAKASQENFWTREATKSLGDRLAALSESCAGSDECVVAKLVAAWPTSAAYQAPCNNSGNLHAVSECLLEYDFWAKMGSKYYPGYRTADSWASFDLPNNPTWQEWYADRLTKCDPGMNKSQEAGDTCVRDHAKRDFGISHDATKGCYYRQLSLSSFCYWMAGFDVFVTDQIAKLQTGA